MAEENSCQNKDRSNIVTKLAYYRAAISENTEAVYDYAADRRYTYGDIELRSNRLADFLLNVISLRKGDRFAVCAMNAMAFIDAWHAALKTGVILSIYNYYLNVHDLSVLIKNETPKLIFFDTATLEKMRGVKECFPDIEFVSLDGENAIGSYVYASIMARSDMPRIEASGVKFSDTQMLIHTGGTTGLPKAVQISHRSIFCNALSALLTLGLSHMDSTVIFLPFFHTTAWSVLTLPLLLCGGKIIIMKRFDAGTALKIIRDEKPSVAIAVATIYRLLSEHPDFRTTDFSCYRWLLSGGAPITKELMRIYWDRGILLSSAYGMTEAGPNNLVFPVNEINLDLIRKKWRSVGKPAYFNQVRIVDKEGREVPTGQAGELIWKGVLTFSGYWQNKAETNIVRRNGWIHSGDIAYRDEDGYYYIAGRKKRMIITGGENIYPEEIEQAIISHAAVRDAAVIGIADNKWGEVPKALVALHKGTELSAESLLKYLASMLSSIKLPHKITFVERIPRNALGKYELDKILQLHDC